jgi:NADP-dependent 3-hydroxy acid dehydrogenase YdfG
LTKARRTISGRTAVISGAASGMGRSLALRLAGHGSPVAITDIDQRGLKETAASISGPVLSRVLDVSDADAQLAFAAEVRDWTPTAVGAVFNNAGVNLASTVLDADPDDDQWLWNINFHGVVNGTRAFLPILVEQDAGAIVNTSSVFGLAGIPGQSAYCAAKFAVRGFTDALRQELRGTGVSAINVHPGGVNTNIVRNARLRTGPQGNGPTHQQMVAEFAATTMTTPDKAAEVIHRGVEAGKSRILIGLDAHLFDILARLAPTRYLDIIERFQAPIDWARRAGTVAASDSTSRPSTRGRRAPIAEAALAFEQCTQAQNGRLVEPLRDELDADRQLLRAVPVRHRECRQASQIER